MDERAVRQAKDAGYDKIAGTIEVGKRSDLLLLEENPLQDIAAAFKAPGGLN